MVGNAVAVNFSGGETSPRSRGRFDQPWYQTSAKKLLNFIADIQGPARFRPGFVFSRLTRQGQIARFVDFQISDVLSYVLEFTPGFMRVYNPTTRELLTSSKATITAVTNASPGVFTVDSTTGFADGDEVLISGVAGMNEINDRQATIAGLSGNTFHLVDSVSSVALDTTSFGTYASGGTVDKVYEIATPYDAIDLANLQWAADGSAGVMYLVCPARAPRKLTVVSNIFSLATFVRTNDPFTGQSTPPSDLFDDFETADLSKWTAVGTNVVTEGSWPGISGGVTEVVYFPYRYAYASPSDAIVGQYLGYIQAAQTKSNAIWQVTLASPISNSCEANPLNVNYFEWRFLMVDANNYYAMEINGANGNTVSIKKCLAGIVTTLGSATITALRGVTAGRIFKIVRESDSTITVYDSGSSVLVVTDSTFTSSTIMQMRVGSSGNSIESGSTADSVNWVNGNAIGLGGSWQVLCWADNVYVSGADASENPLTVAMYEGRLFYGGTTKRPDCLFGSRAPLSTTGAARYDDFTGGSNADHACFFQIAPVAGSTAYISWLRGGPDYLFAGTFGGPFRISGSGLDIPITPSSINVRGFDTAGAEETLPAGLQQIFFIQRAGKTLRSIKVINPYLATFESADMCLNAEQVGYSAMQRIVLQRGRPDALWTFCADGSLKGMSVHLTAQNADTLTGWHGHKLGGSGLVKDLVAVPRQTGYDMLWACVQRTVNGVTRCSIEVQADDVVFPDIEDFYGKGANKAADLRLWQNAMWRLQEQYVHLDSEAAYDGSLRGVAAGATLTPSAVGTPQVEGSSVVPITLTASAAVFAATDVGSEIWVKPSATTGLGAGRALITAYVDAFTVTATPLVAFADTSVVAAGDWYFAVSTVYGFEHLEGTTPAIVADGGVITDGTGIMDPEYPIITVTNGKIALPTGVKAAVLRAGFPYFGIGVTHNLEMGGRSGPAQAKARNISEINVRFLASLGVEYGTDLYALEKVDHRLSSAILDRPAIPFSGIRRVKLQDTWSGLDDATREKNLVFVQRLPLPAVVESLDISYDTADEGGTD